MTPTRRARRTAHGLLALGALALLAACSTASEPTTDEAPEPVSREEAMLAYAQCMRENGVDMADPDGTGQLLLDETVQTDPDWPDAQQACEHHLTQGQPQDAGGGMSAEQREQLLAFAACMRAAGFDFPDPDFSGGGGSIALGGDVDPTDPEVRAPAAVCQQEAGLPEPGGAGG